MAISRKFKAGDLVKIRMNSERFWCKVKKVRGTNMEVRVDNHVKMQPFKIGSKLTIRKRDVIAKY